jgi:hypothetical protein
MRITISNKELKENLEEKMNVDVKKLLLKEFIEYLEVDLPQWIHDNIRSFELKLIEEGRI